MSERLWAATSLALCAVLLLPLLAYRMGVDQGVFAYMGERLLHGDWPYIDTWESDFPGMVLLQAGEILLLGKSIVMFRLFDLLWTLANAYLVLRIAARLGSRSGALLAAGTYCLIYQGYGPWNTGQRENFGLLFILLGYWLFLAGSRRRPELTAAAIGLGFGIAITFKPTLLALSMFYLPLLPQLRKRSLPALAAAAAGLLAPATLIVVAYWLKGGVGDLYEATIAHQEVYTRLIASGSPLWQRWLVNATRLGGTAVAMALGFAPFLLSPRHRRQRAMLYCGYLGSLVAVVAQGTFAGYHYIPGLALGGAMIGIAFSEVAAWVSARAGSRWHAAPVAPDLVAVCLLLLVATTVYWRPQAARDLITLHFLQPPRVGELHNAGVFDFTEDWELAEYLAERTDAEATIQVWGYESLVYYLAQRRAASRFQASHALVMQVPGEPMPERTRRWRREFISSLEAAPPAYVAVVRDDDWWWAPGRRTSEQLLDDFPEWRDFIADNYVAEGSIGRFLIYRHARPSDRL